MRLEQSEHNGIKCVIRYPDGYDNSKKYPTVMYLHGAGGRWGDANSFKNHDFLNITAGYASFPFVCVLPICNAETWFDVFESLKNFTKWVSESDFCDPERLYLMGSSMGGYATWQLAISAPEFFAAIVPICGGGMNWDVGRLINTPVWAFHGANDPTVYLCESEMMVNRLKEWGADPRLTVYEGVGHNAWIPTFKNPEVFKWLLSNKKSSSKELENKYDNTEKFG